MKSFYAFVLLASFLALALALPGGKRESSETSASEDKSPEGVLYVVPRRSIFDDFADSTDDDGDEMPGFWPTFRFNSNPFNDLFTRMQDTMNRIRSQMAAALAGQLGQGGLTPWGKIPEGANTTSTTKVIGDHQVTINETTYNDGDENSGTIFRVRIIDVKPLNETAESNDSDEKNNGEEATDISPEQQNNDRDREELTTPKTSPKTRETETLEEFDNEIPKNQVETLTA